MAHPLTPLGLIFLLLLSSLIMKPCRFRWLIWPVIASQVFMQLYSNSTYNSKINPPLRAVLLAYMFVASDYIILTDVQHELKEDGQREPISNTRLSVRFWWAVRLFCNPRGIGWSHEPKNILPSRPNYRTRGRFIISQLLRLMLYIVIADVGNTLTTRTSVFTKDSLPTSSQPWRWRIFGVILLAIGSVSFINIIHIILSIIGVSVGISDPEGWPPMFGKWTETYSVRIFWGRTWHQILRRPFHSHGQHLARILQLPNKSKYSALINLFTAFVMSGIIHIHPEETRPMPFFIAQACVITFEEFVIAIANRANYTSLTTLQKFLCYIWVLLWFTLSLPGFIDAMIDSGMVESPPNIGIVSTILNLLPIDNYLASSK